MTRVLSEATTALLARESSFGTQPTANWVQVQPNPGGLKDWQNKFKYEERDPLAKYATMEAGEPVGFDATPVLEQDWNKDLIDILAEPMFRSAGKHNGNTGLALFRPTAVTSTGYTVAADGDLTAGLLINAKGFPTTANNGLKVVGSSSTDTEIKTSGLTAETPAATLGATVEVAGVQGASADIVLNGSGNLTSTILDFTTMGLQAEQWIKIGGSTSATQFATVAYNGYAKIVSFTANLITLERHTWTPGAQDLGAGKTIQIFFSRWYRNVSIDHADYLEPTLHGEVEELGPGTSGVATYTYARAMALKTLELNAPLESKIVATMTFCAKDIRDPVVVASRATGADVPRRPMAASLFHTASPHLQRVRLATAAGASLAAEVNSWKFTMEHNVKPREIQGGLGAEDMLYGKVQPSLSMEVYYTDFALPIAARSNPELAWDAIVRNGQGGFVLDMPYVRVRMPSGRTYAANDAVMCSLEIPGFRDPTTNIVAAMTVFAYLPEAAA
jgi:hypothetical protein